MALQAVILYRQHGGSDAAPPPPPAVRDAPKGLAFELTGLPIEGADDARTVLVEFSDYECPFCARHANSVLGELRQKFVSTGKIKYAFANNPLSIHSNAQLLATAAICAGEQGQYWKVHDSLFRTQSKTKADLVSLVRTLSLDSGKFQRCLDESPEPAKQIERDMQKAQEFQLTATPGFALGQVDSQGRVAIQKLIVGAQPLTVFETAINEVLAKKTTS